jgi:hypothetical protein
MNIGKLGDGDSLAILREGTLGRLGCIAAGWPYVVPVNYFFLTARTFTSTRCPAKSWTRCAPTLASACRWMRSKIHITGAA